jgi:AraC family transcriptional regulator
MPELEILASLDTPTVALRSIRCHGTCRHRSDEECAAVTHLVFPYRGIYLRHVGSERTVADANHVVFFNAGESYRISHPVTGGDSCLSLKLPAELLHELLPDSLFSDREGNGFRLQHRQIDSGAQAAVAVLRHALEEDSIEALEAETLSLALVRQSLGSRRSREPAATPASRRLTDRIKVLLGSDLARRWTLAEIATQIGRSPVYLTQIFRKVEGVPLYRYHLRLRLVRALNLIAGYEDLSALAADLGFSSHSHFTAAFRQAYGRSPAAFRQSLGPVGAQAQRH